MTGSKAKATAPVTMMPKNTMPVARNPAASRFSATGVADLSPGFRPVMANRSALSLDKEGVAAKLPA